MENRGLRRLAAGAVRVTPSGSPVSGRRLGNLAGDRDHLGHAAAQSRSSPGGPRSEHSAGWRPLHRQTLSWSVATPGPRGPGGSGSPAGTTRPHGGPTRPRGCTTSRGATKRLTSQSLSRVLGLINCAKHVVIGPATRTRSYAGHPVEFVSVGPDHPLPTRGGEFPRMDPPRADPAMQRDRGISSSRARSVSDHSCSLSTPGPATIRGRGSV